MCGNFEGGFKTASSHTPAKTFDGQTIYMNTTFTLEHMYFGMGHHNKFAGLCQTCARKFHLRCAFWEPVAQIKHLALKVLSIFVGESTE
jgi:hypothetical protein